MKDAQTIDAMQGFFLCWLSKSVLVDFLACVYNEMVPLNMEYPHA